MERGRFQNVALAVNAAHIRPESLQHVPELRAAPFQHVDLALAPRTFAFEVRSSFTDGAAQL
eukprot:2737810-Pyramimonas_sp.AAC.1